MKRWVLVADAARARLFESNAAGTALNEMLGWIHPETREGDTREDTGGGRLFRSGRQASHYQGDNIMAPIERETRNFARALARELNTAYRDHRYEELVLVAPPRMLGELRQQLDDAVEAHLAGTLDKDLTRLPATGIARHLQLH